jgi:hypothetical protein
VLTERLVEKRIEDGEILLKALQRERFPVLRMFWCRMPESQRWRLVIASRLVDKIGSLGAYERLQRILAGLQLSSLSLMNISVLSPSSGEFGRLLEHAAGPGTFGTAAAAGPVRDIVFEDAYFYHV